MRDEYSAYESKGATIAREVEPDIVQAARMFDEAHRELEQLQQQRKKLDIAAKDAQTRMNESAARMRALIDLPTMAAEVRNANY